MPDTATVIRRADWVVAWDGDSQGHCYARNWDVAFMGDRFVHVGPDYAGEAVREVDGAGLMVMPGLVNIHTHPFSEPGNKGILEDLGSPRLGQSNLYEFMPIFDLGLAAAGAATDVAVAEALKSGVTTFVDWSAARDGWAEGLAATGIRAVLCPMYRSARWYTRDGHSVLYDWDEAAGERGFEQSLAVVDGARRHPSGRLDGMIGPTQIDTCTPALLRASLEAARARGLAFQIHAAQSLVEFKVMTERHGRTPIEFLDEHGLLGPDTVVGHGIFLNDHPLVHWPQADDFALLGRSGAAVAHCPVNFSRRGIALNTLKRYVEAGITLGLGTDTFPHNMIDEMRMAAIAGRILAGAYDAGSTRLAFDAATLGGARALKRDDIGRIAVDAKADFALVDLEHASMRPLRDPLRSLVHSSSDRAVRDVFVDGAQVVRDGEVLTIDVERALSELAAAQRRMLETVHERDWAGRGAAQLSPPVYPVRP